MTGFRSWSEFHEETTPEERALIAESIRAWHAARDGGGGGMSGDGSGLGV